LIRRRKLTESFGQITVYVRLDESFVGFAASSRMTALDFKLQTHLDAIQNFPADRCERVPFRLESLAVNRRGSESQTFRGALSLLAHTSVEIAASDQRRTGSSDGDIDSDQERNKNEESRPHEALFDRSKSENQLQ
jgi:hypothetical protein